MLKTHLDGIGVIQNIMTAITELHAHTSSTKKFRLIGKVLLEILYINPPKYVSMFKAYQLP